MKLVDILVREFSKWPEGFECLSQLKHNGSIINGKGFDGRVLAWIEIAGDTFPAGVIVTRAEWQAAVDALNFDKCEHSYGNKIGCPECGELSAPKVVEWDGAGLPPAGSTCQIRHSGWAAGSWETVDIKYISSEYLIIGHGDFKREQHFHMPDIQFRPILTAEQVAAEEREKAIREICIDAGSPELTPGQMKVAEKLYLAGYRKQVAK